MVYASLVPLSSSKRINKIIATAAICTTVIAVVGFYVWYEGQRPPLLEIYIIALKSGQAIFVRTPNDKRILIDGGMNSEIIRHLSTILPFYTRRIDTLVVTKSDGKRVSGLIDILSRYSINEVVVPGVDLVGLGLASSTDQIYQAFLDAVVSAKVPMKKIVAGDSIILDNFSTTTQEVSLDVIFPVSGGGFKYSKASSPELVARISYGSTSVMLAGAATPKIQKFIVNASSTPPSSTDLKSDVLILSQNATTSNIAPVFMSAVSPDDIIYSKAKATNMLKEHRFNIREVGTLKVVSNGKNVEIEDHLRD
ncbi:MAG: hypothetical protein WCO48_00255 [Candidatus Taylorbacteria bacterium]